MLFRFCLHGRYDRYGEHNTRHPAGESGMPGDLVGAIEMFDSYTFVEVPREYGAAVLKAMKNAKIKGKSINVEPANAK